MVKNPPANAGDTGRYLVGEDTTCRGELSLCATGTEACAPRARAPQQEKPLQ